MRRRLALLGVVLLSIPAAGVATAGAATDCELVGGQAATRGVLKIKRISDWYSALRIVQRGDTFTVRISSTDSAEYAFDRSYPGDDSPICDDLGELNASRIKRIEVYLGRHPEGLILDLAGASPGHGLAPGAGRRDHLTTFSVKSGPNALDPRGFLALRGTGRSDEIVAGMRGGKAAVRYTDKKGKDKRWIKGFAAKHLYLLGAGGNDRITGKGEKGAMRDLDDWVRLDIDGGHGADLLIGHDGVDAIYGGTGRDRIHGGYGNDGQVHTKEWARYGLSGGPGSDVIFGGPGNDQIGDWGSYFVDIGRDRVYAGPGRDRILDYKDGDRDRLDCGGGHDEYVLIDRGLDRLKSCERRSG